MCTVCNKVYLNGLRFVHAASTIIFAKAIWITLSIYIYFSLSLDKCPVCHTLANIVYANGTSYSNRILYITTMTKVESHLLLPHAIRSVMANATSTPPAQYSKIAPKPPSIWDSFSMNTLCVRTRGHGVEGQLRQFWTLSPRIVIGTEQQNLKLK